MPAKLVTPTELVRKEAVLIDKYETTQIFINMGDKPYVRIAYNVIDMDGAVVGTAEAILDSDDVAKFVSTNPVFYTAIKKMSYKVGKDKGIIPSDAGII